MGDGSMASLSDIVATSVSARIGSYHSETRNSGFTDENLLPAGTSKWRM